MDNNRLNRWLTLLANIGVLVGLVLLILELRQTNDAILGATYQARTETVENWDKWLAETESVRTAILNYRGSDFQSLSREDQFILFELSIASFNRLDGLFYQYELGLLDEQYYSYMFKAEMAANVPRWKDAGLLETEYYQTGARPSFQNEVNKYVNRDLWK